MDPVKLWKEKRWLFFLLLPIVLVLGVRAIMVALNKSAIEKAMTDAETSEDKVSKEETEIAIERAKVEARAEGIEESIRLSEKRIEDTKASDVSEDWHKEGR